VRWWARSGGPGLAGPVRRLSTVHSNNLSLRFLQPRIAGSGGCRQLFEFAARSDESRQCQPVACLARFGRSGNQRFSVPPRRDGLFDRAVCPAGARPTLSAPRRHHVDCRQLGMGGRNFRFHTCVQAAFISPTSLAASCRVAAVTCPPGSSSKLKQRLYTLMGGPCLQLNKNR